MAVPYYGDFAEDATVYIPFNTFSSDDPSASVTVTNLVNTDVHIHKNGSTTQRNNAAGITMTVDFDSITGNHMVIIDTSDDTVAGFWVAAGEYQVRVEGTTIDGATVNAWVGAFSIERAGGALALLKNATYGLSAIETLVDGCESALTTIDGIVDDILVDTGTTIPGTIATLQGNVTDILTDTGTTLDTLVKDIPTVAEFEARTLVAADYVVVTDTIARVTLVDTCTTNTDMRGTNSAALASVCTETRLAELDAANLPADVDAILTDTGTTIPGTITTLQGNVTDILADTGTDGVVVAAASKTGYALADATSDAVIADAVWNGATATYGSAGSYGLLIETNLDAQVSAVGGGTAADIADAVWNEAIADHAGVGSTGAALAAAGGSGDPWATALPGAYGAGTAGKLIGDNVNAPIATVDTIVDAIKAKTDNLPASPAAVGSQMDLVNAPNATAVTAIQNGLATPTNITAGTITTVTNLTNAATAGDFTATMKTSLNAATPASVQNIPANGSGLTALGDSRIANLDATVSSRLAPAGTLARVTLTDTCTTNTDMRGTDSAALASVCTEGRLAELDAANLPTDIADVPTAAEIKTAIEAAGSLLDLLAKANVYKLIINEATGAAEMFDAAGTSLGTIAAAFTSAGGMTTRKKMVV